MNMIKSPIFFLKVADNSSKLKRLCDVIQEHFLEGVHIQISVPSAEAATYIDQLLWRLPEESFLPHFIVHEKSSAQIVITTKPENLNKATILFNLCPEVPPMSDFFEKIYDLYDETQPSKLALSQQRQSAYQAAGHSISLL